jgi:hypothetical protein
MKIVEIVPENEKGTAGQIFPADQWSRRTFCIFSGKKKEMEWF